MNSRLDTTGKTCSICGVWHSHDEYVYGNKSDRSYCRACNKEERGPYPDGGVEGAHSMRETMRGKWRR